MKLALLLIPEDLVMQILWKYKRISLPDIRRKWIQKKKPTLKTLERIISGLVAKKFIEEKVVKGIKYFAPHSSKKNSIRFRANYDLIGYFDGTMRQLDRFVDEYEVEGMTVHDGLHGLGSSLLYPSLVRNYYQVTYPRAVINTIQLDNAFVNKYLKIQKSKIGKFVVLGHSKLKDSGKTALIVVAKDIAKLRKVKRIDPKLILKDKSILLHEEALN